MKKITKEVVFVGDNLQAGSVIMNGVQIAEEMNKHTTSLCVALRREDILKMRNKIIVLLGLITDEFGLTKADLEQLHDQYNIVVIDGVDKLCYLNDRNTNNESDLYLIADGVIFANSFQQNHFKDGVGNKSIVIPHCYDSRLNHETIVKNNYFSVDYLGSHYPNPYLHELKPHWLSIDFSGHTNSVYEVAKKSNCHFSHRMSNTVEFFFKPCTKLAMAAATNSCIIASRDKSNIEILPEYTLYVSDDPEDIAAKYDIACSAFKTPKWHSLVDELKAAKEKTDVKNVVHLYINFFEELLDS